MRASGPRGRLVPCSQSLPVLGLVHSLGHSVRMLSITSCSTMSTQTPLCHNHPAAHGRAPQGLGSPQDTAIHTPRSHPGDEPALRSCTFILHPQVQLHPSGMLGVKPATVPHSAPNFPVVWTRTTLVPPAQTTAAPSPPTSQGSNLGSAAGLARSHSPLGFWLLRGRGWRGPPCGGVRVSLTAAGEEFQHSPLLASSSHLSFPPGSDTMLPSPRDQPEDKSQVPALQKEATK